MNISAPVPYDLLYGVSRWLSLRVRHNSTCSQRLIVWCVYGLQADTNNSFVVTKITEPYGGKTARQVICQPADSPVLSSDLSLVTGGSLDYKRPNNTRINNTYTAHAAGCFVILSVDCVCSSIQICCLNSS